MAERAAPVLQGILITAVCSWIFYDSWWGMLWIVGVLPFWCRRMEKRRQERKKCRMRQECREMLQLLSSSLQAGYSVERAFAETEKELCLMYREESLLLPELEKMNRLVSVNRPVEEAFLTLALHVKLDEMSSLGYIFSQAKRTGGDYGELIRSTAGKLEENLRTKQEIQTMTAQKQLELQIMSAMPAMILFYIRLTSYDFISPLYHNLVGILLMSICMIWYGVMILFGDRLIQIEI